MTDILLMESYVTEKMPDVSWDTISMVKMQFYKKILAKHKVDSVAFYTTFNYLQAHPKEFEVVLKLVDSSLTKINPGDTTFIQPVVTIPKNIGNLPNFKEQEKAMQGEFIKKIMRSQDKKTKDEE